MPIVPAAASGDVAHFREPPRPERSFGRVRLGFVRRGATTAVAELFQSGCAKVRFPKVEPTVMREAILLNTAGGLTDGDRLKNVVSWGSGARAAVITQAAERVYRSRAAPSRIETCLNVGPNALALWLPQETILFDGAHMRRTAEADLDPTGRMVACESLIFGHAAMGEAVRSGTVTDSWWVRIGGHLVFADTFRLAGDIEAALDRPAVGSGARGIATLLYAGADAADHVEAIRSIAVPKGAQVGCSCLGKILIVRVLAASGLDLRKALTAALTGLLRGVTGAAMSAPLPRVWLQ